MFLTEEQRQKYLLPMVRGEATGAYATTETWVVNGTKAYITNAQYADLIFVCVLHDPR